MNPYLRSHQILRLIDQIRVIAPGSAFERFGGRLLDHYLGILLTHRGLNALGHPVGGTVDTIDETGTKAAEYSSEKSYFGESMTKATSDACHVLALHPLADNIFLISSQEAPVGKITELKSEIAQRPEFVGRTLHIYDSRKIAEILVDHLLVSDTAVDQLSEWLPALKEIRDEHAANLLMPETDFRQHIDLSSVTEEIERRLAESPCLVIWSVAGAGKSDAAASFAAQHKDDYELVVWFEGDKVGRIEDLRYVPLLRGGDSRNVSTLLSNRRCLVVIDDARVILSPIELAKLCRKDSHVVITQRFEEETGFELPLMPENEAVELLNYRIATVCPKDVWTKIWSTVGGHPLSLGLMNTAVLEGAPWSDIAADCSAVGELEDGHQRLIDRLLERLKPVLANELSVFAWAGQPTCDHGFLRYAIKPLGLRKLKRHGLTAADRAMSFRIHDVVFASMAADTPANTERRSELNDLLEAYIIKVSAQPGLAFIAVAASFKHKLEKLVRSGDRRAAYLYALVYGCQPNELDPQLLGDPIVAAGRLSGRMGVDVRVDVSAIIETIEGLYRSEKLTLGMDGAKANLKSRFPVFDMLATRERLSDRQVAELKHHKGKALSIIGEYEVALGLFEEVLAGPCPLHESRLQLIRIYARKDATAPQAAKLADDILTAAYQPNEVSNSVMLAAVDALPWGKGAWRDKLMAQHADTIENAILEATAAGLDQGYQTFATVGRHWAWHDADRFRNVWRKLPPRTPSSVAGDQERFHYGEILQLAAKIFPDMVHELQDEALEFFEAVTAPNDFQIQKHGQLLVEMDHFDDAKRVLEAIRDVRFKPWALYWLSKAQLNLDDAPAALEQIDLALGLLTEKMQSYLSTFCAQRYEVRRKLGDMDALEDLNKAIAACEDPKHRRLLKDRLADTNRPSAS